MAVFLAIGWDVTRRSLQTDPSMGTFGYPYAEAGVQVVDFYGSESFFINILSIINKKVENLYKNVILSQKSIREGRRQEFVMRGG